MRGMHIEHGLLPGHVLQRTPQGASVTVRGTCRANGPVLGQVRVGKRCLRGFTSAAVGEAVDGRFTATLSGLPSGGPYVVELQCGKQRVVVGDVFVGDLWLMAGQSNMEGAGLIADAPPPHAQVRSFSMARRWELARDPLHFLDESPDAVHGTGILSRADVRRCKRLAVKGTGSGVFFGTDMHRRSKVPQGLIATAHGGTSMTQWDPALKDQGAASLYGSLWLSVHAVGQPLAGVLWYQGCSDTGTESALYTSRMQALVAALRRDLRQPRLPWVVVQIGRVVDLARDPKPWNSVQEQQRCLPQQIRHCDVVTTIDLELDDNIHLSGKAHGVLAGRMARVAARLVLGDRGEAPAPQPQDVRLQAPKPGLGPVVAVRFKNVVGGLRADGLANGFSLVDAQQKPFDLIFKTEVIGNRALLHLRMTPPEPCWLMYGQGVNPVCNVHDARGMALPVCGPWPLLSTLPLSEWCQRWRVSPLRADENLMTFTPRSADDALATDRSFDGKFINLHTEWQGKTGHMAFTGFIDVDEDMRVEVRLGYDGPVRLWLGRKELHRDLRGSNPALHDTQRLVHQLPAGRHRLVIAMALNGGRAWGFFLRFARLDGTLVPQPWA